MNKKKLKIARKKVDQLDKKIFNLIKKRTQIVKYMLSLKKFKKEIIDHRRISEILKKVYGNDIYEKKIKHLNKKEFEELLNMIIELVHKLNEMVRFLAVNPDNVIQIAYDLQKIERETDLKYRNLVKIIMKEIPGAKDAMLLKDAAEHIEEMADRCLSAADSITIIAIGL